MSIAVVRHPDRIIIRITNDDLPKFKELVQRATNLWPDASPEIKEFADDITHDGIIMQDYKNASVTNQVEPARYCTYEGRACKRSCKAFQCKTSNEARK